MLTARLQRCCHLPPSVATISVDQYSLPLIGGAVERNSDFESTDAGSVSSYRTRRRRARAASITDADDTTDYENSASAPVPQGTWGDERGCSQRGAGSVSLTRHSRRRRAWAASDADDTTDYENSASAPVP